MDDSTNNGSAPSQQNQGEDKKDPSDQLTPEHPRFKQVLDQLREQKTQNEDLKKELADLRDQVTARKETNPDAELTQQEEAALHKIQTTLKERGFLTKEQLEESRRVEKRAQALDAMTREYDGKNGYPKFDAEEVVAYARANGFGDNFKAAYRELHYDAIVQLDAKKAAGGGGNTPPGSERPSGGEHGRPDLGLSADDIRNMSDADYEKNREKILGAIRPR